MISDGIDLLFDEGVSIVEVCISAWSSEYMWMMITCSASRAQCISGIVRLSQYVTHSISCMMSHLSSERLDG